MAYEITPFQLLPSPQDQRPAVGYGSGVGNPNDYEYYVDPQTRTVKRRAKTDLQARAEAAAPTSGGSDTFGAPTGGNGGGWSSMTPGEQAAFYGGNPGFAAVTQGLQSAFGLTGLGMALQAANPIGWGEQSMIGRGIDPGHMGLLNSQVEANAAQPGFNANWGGGLLGTLGDQPGDFDGQGTPGQESGGGMLGGASDGSDGGYW